MNRDLNKLAEKMKSRIVELFPGREVTVETILEVQVVVASTPNDIACLVSLRESDPPGIEEDRIQERVKEINTLIEAQERDVLPPGPERSS